MGVNFEALDKLVSKKVPQTASAPAKAVNSEPPINSPKQGSERKIEPFMSTTGTRDYKKLYRAALDYHMRHSPPMVNVPYWQSHTAGEDEAPLEELDYWTDAADDMGATSETFSDPFLDDLLVCVYSELAREYDTLRERAKG